MSAGGSRLAFIDALKALASQLIVLHHLAFYGPMSDYVQPLFPGMISWFSQNARIAVQVFLVIGGFLAAQALARNGRLVEKPVLALIWRRYLKLVLPYLAALLLAIAGAAIARHLITHASIPGAPTLPQLIAHVFLLQSILGFDGLSAGVWYVAIDFQLYTLLLVVLWLARRSFPDSPNAGVLLTAALIIASLFHFNRDPEWDNWAIYFFGAYGLGAITYWSVRRNTLSPWRILIVALVLAALLIDYRSRIAVALLVAIALGLARYTGGIESWPKSRVIAWFGQISYAVFLVHFPICLVINALFERFALHTPAIQLSGMFVAWVACVGGGALFYYQIECRARRLLSGKTRAAGATL
jgi:peptidoglycan/LPS O-acetylase OafA/YrhL